MSYLGSRDATRSFEGPDQRDPRTRTGVAASSRRAPPGSRAAGSSSAYVTAASPSTPARSAPLPHSGPARPFRIRLGGAVAEDEPELIPQGGPQLRGAPGRRRSAV